MQQQINLYSYLPQKERSLLTPTIVSGSYGGFCLLLLIFYLTTGWQKHQLNSEINKLMLSIATEQQQLTTLTQRYPETDPEIIKKSIATLQQTYQTKSKEMDQLSFNSYYSQYLLALGNAIVPGVWLTEIEFDRGDDRIILQGYLLQPILLESFYKELIKQPIFSNLVFKVDEIQQTKFPANFHITGKRKD